MSTFVVQCLTAQCPRYTQIAEVIKLRVIITMALLLSLGVARIKLFGFTKIRAKGSVKEAGLRLQRMQQGKRYRL